jgi:hypothetical protein
MTICVMLDLETWGKRPGCDIRSIGACVFDPVGGVVSSYDPTAPEGHRYTGLDGLFYIACDNPTVPDLNKAKSGEEWYTRWDGTAQVYRKYPLTRDPDTVQWWSEQSDDAQSAFTGAVDLKQALYAFRGWLDVVTAPSIEQDGKLVWTDAFKVHERTDLRIYAHGPQFDCSILEAAYHAVGLPVPWHYRAPRDTRTVFDVCGVGDHSAWMARYPVGTAHHALDDAVSQARAVCGAMALTRSPAVR